MDPEESIDDGRSYNFRKRQNQSCLDATENFGTDEEWLSNEENYESIDDDVSSDSEKLLSKKQKNFEVSPEVSQIIKMPDFEIQPTFRGRKCLIIFDSANRDMCYKFYIESRSGNYFCFGCRENHWKTEAKLFSDETESEKPYVLLKNEHRCESIPYIKKSEIILEESEFKTCLLPTGKQRIFIFDKEKEKLGYEFAWRKKDLYICLSCEVARVKNIYIRLCQHENGKNYVRATNEKHLCKLRDFNPEKYEDKLVHAPNFKFYRKGTTALYMLIITSEDQTKCYDYWFSRRDNRFICQGCRKLGKGISAKVFKNDEGKEYFRLFTDKHVCEMLDYEDVLQSCEKIKFCNESGLFSENNITKEIKIIKNNGFQMLSKNGIPDKNLVIFDDENDKTKGYIYHKTKRGEKRYRCLKCHYKQLHVSAKLCAHENGEKYLKLGDIKHVCKPTTIDYGVFDRVAEDSSSSQQEQKPMEEKLIYPPNYQTYHNEKRNREMILFCNDDRTIGYNYGFTKKRKMFHCNQCIKSKIRVEASILNDEDGNDFLKLSKTQHICEPIEVSSLSMKKVDKVIKESSFQFKADDEEIPENNLILFSNKEKTKYWNYRYRPSDKNYVCMECKYLKQYVMAKVLVNKLGEKFLRLGAYDHICEPKDYLL